MTIPPSAARSVSHESAALALLSSWMKSESLLFKIYSNTFTVQDLLESCALVEMNLKN